MVHALQSPVIMIKSRGIASLLVSLELCLKSHRTWLPHCPDPLFEIDKQIHSTFCNDRYVSSLDPLWLIIPIGIIGTLLLSEHVSRNWQTSPACTAPKTLLYHLAWYGKTPAKPRPAPLSTTADPVPLLGTIDRSAPPEPIPAELGWNLTCPRDQIVCT